MIEGISNILTIEVSFKNPNTTVTKRLMATKELLEGANVGSNPEEVAVFLFRGIFKQVWEKRDATEADTILVELDPDDR